MKKLTLTIGIPAFNESENIENMVRSICRQRGSSFVLKSILIVLDGCSDNTYQIAKNLSVVDKRVKIINGKQRLGKTSRLNQIHSLSNTDLIGTFDADIVLARNCELELMVKKFHANKKLNVVAGNQIPLSADSMYGRASWASFVLFYEAAKKWKHANNIHLLQGSASVLKAGFAKSFVYPQNTTSDQGYLYMQAVARNRLGFCFAKETQIYFRTVSTLKDWRSLGKRTLISDKVSMVRDFGNIANKEYKLPKHLVLKSVLRLIRSMPLEAILAIGLNIYLRMTTKPKQERLGGAWEMLASSKHAINL